MTFTRSAAALAAALAVLAVPTVPARAAWDNVFQVCCNDCRPRVAFSNPCPPEPCPQPEMRISYVQRTFYQPVTEYVRKSYYEPVTKKVTSYYYEPVTEYKYTTYYDPCTGCPQRVCQPTTSYRLRSQCNSVTSYVERCAMVPVTSLKPVTYQQPVVSYYYPPTASGSFFPPAPAAAPPAAAGPTVEQLRESQPSVMPGGSDTNIPKTQVPVDPQSRPRPGTALRPEKTVSRSSTVAVRGEVVTNDQITPRPGAKLVFVNAEKQDEKKYATANAFGEFDLTLKSGTWFMYVGGTSGNADFHKKLTLGDRDTVDYKVVSR
jgi:hypothetical protein